MKSKHILLAIMIGILFDMTSFVWPAAALAGPRRIEVTARRTAFDPALITLKKGEPVVLILKSADVPHGLRFHELNIDIRVGKGATAEARFTPGATGDFVGHCSVFCGSGHGAMTLTIHVAD